MLDLQSQSICVTGGGGFLGSFVVDALRQRGCERVFVPRKRDYDLTRLDNIERMLDDSRPDVLFHLAAVVGGIGANRDNPGLYFYENAVMGIQLIEAARKFQVAKSIVAGTICSYPKFCPTPFHEDDLWNGYPEETNAPYGIAKKAMLVQCQAYRRQYGMNAVFLMPVNLYGPRDNFDLESSHVIPALIRKFLAAREGGRAEVEVWGDGTPTREFLYVADAAEGIVRAAERYNDADPVNLGSGHEVSIRELVEMVAEATGYHGQIIWNTSKPNGQPRRLLDTTRAAERFGFRAQMPLAEGLKRTTEWWRQHSTESVAA